MATPTLEELRDTYMTALASVAMNQSYSINGRTFTKQNLKEIRDTIDWLNTQIATTDSASAGNGGFVLARFNRES